MAPTTTSTSSSAKPAAEKTARKVKETVATSTEVVSNKAAAKKTAAVVAAVVAAAPAAAAAAPSSSSSSSSGSAAVAPISAPKESAGTKLLNLLEDLSANRAKIDAATLVLNDLRREDRKIFAAIGKQTPYVKKVETKNTEKSIKRRANGQPNGLAKPALASDAMNAFLGNPAGTEVSRLATANAVTKYCRDHLKTGSTKGHRVLDAKMTSLWPGLKEIQLFRLQSHLKDHFPVAVKDKTAAAAKK